MGGAVLLGPQGGTRAWRRLVAAVLARDGYTCQMRRRCEGAPATTANHIVPRVYGGADRMDNLEAACVPCNMGAGAHLAAQAQLMLAHHNAVTSLVQLLDRLGVPTEATVSALAVILPRYSPHPWRREEIVAAVLHRRARGPLVRV